MFAFLPQILQFSHQRIRLHAHQAANSCPMTNQTIKRHSREKSIFFVYSSGNSYLMFRFYFSENSSNLGINIFFGFIHFYCWAFIYQTLLNNCWETNSRQKENTAAHEFFLCSCLLASCEIYSRFVCVVIKNSSNSNYNCFKGVFRIL